LVTSPDDLTRVRANGSRYGIADAEVVGKDGKSFALLGLVCLLDQGPQPASGSGIDGEGLGLEDDLNGAVEDG
jgi:hypothetical protein